MKRNYRDHTARLIAAFVAFTLFFKFCGAPPALTFAAALQKDSGLSLASPLKLRWQFETERIGGLTPAVWQDRIYLPLSGGGIVALHAGDGQILWKNEAGGSLSATPTADAHAVYVAASTTPLDSHGSPAPKNAESTAARAQTKKGAGAPQSFLRAFAETGGVTLWSRAFDAPLNYALVGDEGNIYAACADEKLYAVDKKSGGVVWTFALASPFVTAPLLAAGRIYAADANGALYAIEAQSGKELWRYQTQKAARGVLAADAATLYMGTSEGKIFAIRLSDGRQAWRTRVGGAALGLAPTAQGLLVTSLDNFAYMLSLKRGDRLWKTQLAGRIEAPPLVSGDAALFAPLAGDSCVALNLRDGKPLNSLPVGEENNTAAAPQITGDTLLLTTRRGLLAFTPAANAQTADEKRRAGAAP